MSGKSLMHDGEESNCGVVPTKQPNKSERSPAEAVEGRPQTKENTPQPNSCRTPSRDRGHIGLVRVREAVDLRLDASIQGRNRVQHGSVRGAISNGRPYRDCHHLANPATQVFFPNPAR
jgi:hypothetical protein